jgi:hypothetical protein
MPGHLAHSSEDDDLANSILHYHLGVNSTFSCFMH